MRSAFVLTMALTAAGLVSGAMPLAAQNRDETDTIRFERRLDGPDRLMSLVMNRRARLGIKVNLQARDTDSLGAYVESVVPNGPAAKAGLRSGDVITKLDGKSVLSGGQAEQGADKRQSLPGLRLIELAARLQPNDTVPVEYLRGKDRKTVSVITENEPDSFVMGPDGHRPVTMQFRGPGPERLVMGDVPDEMGMGGHFELFAGGPLADLDLAPLNSDLGNYFGTTDGILVIRAPEDNTLGLKGGDVVQAVDGRKPSSPAHLLRILRSYDKGETFKLDILRNRKHETVTARLGDHDG
ncbi:MAG TPA: PDZ domain-containing protein [Gemmatimonadales bacterium]|nr:PDZ domain-containing protein [Gemmatimonadales bacterium]